MLGYKIKDVKRVTGDIGMDLRSDKTEYLWFLKSVLTSLIPINWKKEELAGKTYYHND